MTPQSAEQLDAAMLGEHEAIERLEAKILAWRAKLAQARQRIEELETENAAMRKDLAMVAVRILVWTVIVFVAAFALGRWV